MRNTKPRPVVLMTDFGIKDPYAGILKAIVYGLSPETVVFDLTHGIKNFRLSQAALVLKSNFRYFPKGSIFVCVVDPGVGTRRRILAARSKDYIFIAPDNGLLSGVSDEENLLEIRSVTNKKFYLNAEISRTFHGRDIMAPLSAHLSRARASKDLVRIFKTIGEKAAISVHLEDLKVKISGQAVEGKIVYFDQFGNAVTNITPGGIEFFDLAEIYYKGRKTGGLKSTYGEFEKKELSAIINSSGLLELAVKEDSARNVFSMQVGEKITLRIPAK